MAGDYHFTFRCITRMHSSRTRAELMERLMFASLTAAAAMKLNVWKAEDDTIIAKNLPRWLMPLYLFTSGGDTLKVTCNRGVVFADSEEHKVGIPTWTELVHVDLTVHSSNFFRNDEPARTQFTTALNFFNQALLVADVSPNIRWQLLDQVGQVRALGKGESFVANVDAHWIELNS